MASLLDELKAVTDDAELTAKLAALSDEEMTKLLAETTPYETSMAPHDKRMLAFSHTNLREDYLTKFIMTAVSGFLYRRATEFLVSSHKDPEVQENVVGREVVKAFLATCFEFNPDEHVQQATRPLNTQADIDRAIKVMRVGAVLDAADDAVDAAIVAEPPPLDEVLEGLPRNVPNDTFGWLNTYVADNYERLRWATRALYGVLPSLEAMIQPVEVFDGPDPAEEYKIFEDAHRENTKFSLTACRFGSWAILGPFQSNRKKVSFLNKESEVLRLMLEQHEKDERLGQELMRKRISKRKQENIARVGPDAKGLEAYESEVATGSGAKRVLTKDQRAELETSAQVLKDRPLGPRAAAVLGAALAPDAPKDAARVPAYAQQAVPSAVYNDDHNPPEGAITVNVFTGSRDGLKAGHMFTEAVAPDKEQAMADVRRDELLAAEKTAAERRAAATATLTASGKIGKRRGAAAPAVAPLPAPAVKATAAAEATAPAPAAPATAATAAAAKPAVPKGKGRAKQ